MRKFLLVQIAVALALAAPSAGFAAQNGRPVSVPQDRTAQVDKLLDELKKQHNETAARRVAQRLQATWSESGSASVDLMMGWAQKAISQQKFDVALDFLDQVVMLKPDYVEGWNRRATVHYLMHNFGMSMADLNQALSLEPRHFGALSGVARIMSETDNKELALKAWEKVLAVYPMMRSAQEQVSTLSEDLTGSAI